MKIKRPLTLLVLVVALILTVVFLFGTRPAIQDRTYVIGWVASPPDEVPTKSGNPTGFSVELVREAARRRRIRLKWVEHPESSEAALRSKAVDLWPMMIITEERKKFFYLTDPYQEDEYALYVNEKSAFMKATDFNGQTISSEGIPIDLKLLREYFPESLQLPKPSLAEAIRSVCDGEAQAFFDDRLTVFALLLKNPPCPSTSFRMIPIQSLKIEFAVGATLESRGAADAIRDEIGVMGRDGSLEKIVSVWSPAASQELLTLTKLQQSKSHLREYKLGLASVATLFVLALCSAAGYRRQRTKAQAYSQALGAAEKAFARQKLESVGMLASGIAHDFNNILGAVLFKADLALDDLAAGNSPEQELKGIREAAIRGSEIVRQLMVYSGKETEVPELVDVSTVVDEMLNLLRISISKRAVLAIDLGKDLPNIRVNPAQVRQIIMNLVTNASEAIGDRDGVIDVKTARLTVSRDSSGTTSEHWPCGDFVQLEVSDTGCGIPSEAQAYVFDPFFTTKSAGRGLGLAVVHGIVEALGGTIRLESEVGRGTKCQILLPCAESRADVSDRQMSPAGRWTGISNRTILLVEDEDPLRRPVAKMLQSTGFTVLEAVDGHTALQIIRATEKSIDILLLDISLPGASSREVFEQAKRLRPEMKVIVTSAYSEQMAATSLAGAVEHFVRKPYGVGDLLATIHQTFT